MSGQHTRSAALVATVVVLVVGVAVYRQRSTPPASAARPNADLPRLLDLGSDKCQPCKEMAPILAELKREYAGKATVDFLDVWKDAAAAEPYGIRVIPTQIFYDRDGKEVWRHEGFLAKDEIIAKLKELGAE